MHSMSVSLRNIFIWLPNLETKCLLAEEMVPIGKIGRNLKTRPKSETETLRGWQRVCRRRIGRQSQVGVCKASRTEEADAWSLSSPRREQHTQKPTAR